MKLTPMLQQYLRIKAEHRDAILLFRLGDFYEMFFEDAEIASRILDITLTARNRGEGVDAVPLCGIPFHAAEPYVATTRTPAASARERSAGSIGPPPSRTVRSDRSAATSAASSSSRCSWVGTREANSTADDAQAAATEACSSSSTGA